jgi:superfamily II DNA/RNA helicase
VSSVTFQDFSIDPKLKRSLEAQKFVTPTPIQALAIPPLLEGRDLFALAQTGTGKTLAFLVPLLQKLILQPQSSALVLLPTRELAEQVQTVYRSLTANWPQAKSVLVIGGASMEAQERMLRSGFRCIMATPGRLNDLIRRGRVDLRRVETLVLDEADRLLDMGFAPQIATILERLPQKRQTMMLSATLGQSVKKLAAQTLREAQFLMTENAKTKNVSIEESCITCAGTEKRERLIELLLETRESTLVFVRTKRGADQLTRSLHSANIHALAIHGDRNQSQRRRALEDLRQGHIQALVATDVASRGLDLDGIGLVVNYDLPESVEDYTHRIGRTGRAGQKGKAVSFVTPAENSLWLKLKDRKELDRRDLRHLKARKQSGNRPESLARGKSFAGKRRFRSKTEGRPQFGGGPRRDRRDPVT